MHILCAIKQSVAYILYTPTHTVTFDTVNDLDIAGVERYIWRVVSHNWPNQVKPTSEPTTHELAKKKKKKKPVFDVWLVGMFIVLFHFAYKKNRCLAAILILLLLSLAHWTFIPFSCLSPSLSPLLKRIRGSVAFFASAKVFELEKKSSRRSRMEGCEHKERKREREERRSGELG